MVVLLVSVTHRLTTMSAHMHAYCYLLVESRMKTGLRATALCRKDRVVLSKHKINNNSKIDFSYNDS